MLHSHIYPYFIGKGLRLKDTKPKDLETYYSYKAANGMNPNTIHKHHQLIRAALYDAVKNELIDKNPAALASRPRTSKSENDYYTAAELAQLLSLVKGSVIETPVMIAICLGLRRSEIVGLKWSNINFDKREVDICNKITVSGKKGACESAMLKTDASAATMPMPDILYTYLKELHEQQKDMPRETNEYKDYVCVNEVGVRLHPDFITYKFHKMLDESGLRRIRFHDLRHSCVSLLVNNNFNMKDIQKYARHATFEQTANTYSHLYPGTESRMSDCISDVLSAETHNEGDSQTA